MEGTWTITQLAERAAAALTAGEPERFNGRVRDLPNERLIRWYTTIGLVDPPLGRRGRTALYGHRHLLQIVAVKRRQGAGRALAEIQTELTGATDDHLNEIARLPAPDTPTVPAPDDGDRGERGRFWAARPASPPAARPVSPPAAEPPTTNPPTTGLPPDGGERAAASEPALVQGVRLSPDLTVLLNVGALSADDLAAIRTAARPLLDELHRRGLTAPPPPQPEAPPADHPGRST